METKPLHSADFETGMKFQQALNEANQKVELAQAILLEFVNNMRKRYDAPEGEFALLDWQQGFVAINGNGAGHGESDN